jgi:hypothetical protein
MLTPGLPPPPWPRPRPWTPLQESHGTEVQEAEGEWKHKGSIGRKSFQRSSQAGMQKSDSVQDSLNKLAQEVRARVRAANGWRGRGPLA